jgi:hypothetical protein
MVSATSYFETVSGQ